MKLSLIFVYASLLLLSSCAKQNEGTDNADHIDFYAEDANAVASASDPLRRNLARLFLVEQPTITANPTMVKAIQTHTPGGILFWNDNKVGALETREVVRTYSQAAKAAGRQPILFSIDYEGGGLELSPSGRLIPGVQRLRKGLTALAHPVWLGQTMPAFGDEACALHGAILAKELLSIGINYPLGTVSDLAARFVKVRGISTKPALVTRCMGALMKSVAAGQDMIFVTKHFPGLAQVSGDTHEGVATSTATTESETSLHLQPFRDLIGDLNTLGLAPKLSLMSTHALFPYFDRKHLTTESPAILTTLLRDQLGFQGIRLSDAMWMGNYGRLGNDSLLPVYVSAILAGEDMLMIPGVKFQAAMQYVWGLYDGTLSPAQQAALERHLGARFDDIRARFMDRAREAIARQDFSVAAIRHSADSISQAGQSATALTAPERARYYDILRRTDSRWAGVFGR